MTRLPGPAAAHSRRKSRVPSSDALSTTMVSRLRQLLSTARLCRQARVNAMLLQASTMTLTRGSARLAIAASIALARCAQRSEEHTSELQSLMRISYAVFCLKKKKTTTYNNETISPDLYAQTRE